MHPRHSPASLLTTESLERLVKASSPSLDATSRKLCYHPATLCGAQITDN